MYRAVRVSCSLLVVALSSLACEKPTNVVLDPKQPVLFKRSDKLQLVAHVMSGRFENGEAAVNWTSADPNVVAVDSRGVIQGVHSGITTVTAESSGISASVPVEVRFVEKITAVDKAELNYDDESFDPKVVLTTYSDIVLKEQPMFDSKDEKICRVDHAGQLHPGNVGETVITARLDGQSVTIPCTVKEEEKGKKKKK